LFHLKVSRNVLLQVTIGEGAVTLTGAVEALGRRRHMRSVKKMTTMAKRRKGD
jgi:hypothetical protein